MARWLALFSKIVAVFLVFAGCGTNEAGTLPHLVIVCIDTLRVDHVGAYGYDRPTTPNLDRLAARSVVFESAQAASSWTVPSVASLLTSLPPHRHGAGVVGDVRSLKEGDIVHQVAPAVPTLARTLQHLGYSTALFSANPFLYGRFGDGFETKAVEWVDAESLTDRALSWLAGRDSRPRLLYLQFMDLHQPNRPPEPYFQAFRPSNGQPNLPEHSDWKFGSVADAADPAFLEFRQHRTAVYDGSLLYVDFQIQRLLDVLEALPFRGNTWIVVTSDHGEELWDHLEEEREQAVDPRMVWGIGHGHTLYEELLHVPLIISTPGLSVGSRVSCPASLLDLAPTLVAATGRDRFASSFGVDLGPWLREPDAPCRPRETIAESPAYGPDRRSIRLSNWKLIQTFGRPPELYDLSSDPDERDNLALIRPEIVKALSKRLGVIQKTASKSFAASPVPDSALAEQLRALGYL